MVVEVACVWRVCVWRAAEGVCYLLGRFEQEVVMMVVMVVMVCASCFCVW